MVMFGSTATDYAVTFPLPYFWYGQVIDPCSSVEMFLNYKGNYYGCIYGVPSSRGRIITTSDQDWVRTSYLYPAADSLMKNIIFNLAKTSYNCVNQSCIPPVTSLLSSDSTFCANSCIDYTDRSTNNPTSWQWTFQGALPAKSTAKNPQTVCYPNGGSFTVTLIAGNSYGSDTAIYTNFISVSDAPPTPTINRSNDTLFCSSDTSYTSYQWYEDSTLIAGSTNTFLVFMHSGNYNVKVTNKIGCSIAVGINIVGIKEVTVNGMQFAVSPNPVKDEFTIHPLTNGSQFSIEQIEIYNVIGERTTPSFLTGRRGESAVINVSALPAGIYFLTIITKTETLTGKFIKE